jgi:hypothetical protein
MLTVRKLSDVDNLSFKLYSIRHYGIFKSWIKLKWPKVSIGIAFEHSFQTEILKLKR